MYKTFHADQALRQDIVPEIIKKIVKRGKKQTTVWFDRLTDVMCRNLDRGELERSKV